MNPNQMTDAKLSLWLGKVLEPEKTLHNQTAYNAPDDDFFTWQCVRCGLKSCYDISEDRCPETDPIPLDDWNVAMKRRDWAVEDCNIVDGYSQNYWRDAKIDVWKRVCDKYGVTDLDVMIECSNQFFADDAQPRHFLEAVAKCKENSNAK